MNWKSSKTAPKDGLCFIAQVKDHPYAVPCKWNRLQEEFMYLTDQSSLCDSEWCDDYFESEWCHEVKAWQPMPEVK